MNDARGGGAVGMQGGRGGGGRRCCPHLFVLTRGVTLQLIYLFLDIVQLDTQPTRMNGQFQLLDRVST